MSGSPAGADRAEDYDRFVDWDKRLDREGPFFRDVFGRTGARRVVDVGCGTGKHAVMFATWGLDVLAVDPSEEMLAQARVNAAGARERIAAAHGSVSFVSGGFGQVAGLLGEPADALVCTGNALPHVDGLPGLREALRDFAASLRPGGALVLHLLNHDRLVAGGVRAVPPVVREDDEGTWVFLRVLDHVSGAIRFDFVTMHRPRGWWESGAGWETSSRRSAHTALPTSVLVAELGHAGFTGITLFGSHALKRFDASADESVIVSAIRG